MINLYKKGLIFAIILFFIFANIIPSINGDIENKNNKLSAKQIVNLIGDNSCQTIINSQETYVLNFYGYELDQFQISNGNRGFDVGYYDLIQSFKPSKTPLVKVDILGQGKYDDDTLKISIKEYLNGDDLTYIFIPGNKIPPNLSWLECDFPDIDVEPEKTYYIVINQEEDGKYHWIGDSGYDYYNRGFSYSHQEYTQIWDNLSEIIVNFDFCFKTYSYGDNLPPNIPTINGSISGKAGTKYGYEIYTIDPEENDVYYLIDWGDGVTSEWLGPYESGEVTHFDHSWEEKDGYTLKVKSKDIFGDKSDWATLEVSMSKNKLNNMPFLRFLESHSCMFPVLRYIFGL